MAILRLITAVSVGVLLSLSGCVLEGDLEGDLGESSVEVTADEAGGTPGECEAEPNASDDQETAADCGDAVVCACSCNGVPVNVTIHPEKHGETCADVNGRPCNTGNGWFTYTGCG